MPSTSPRAMASALVLILLLACSGKPADPAEHSAPPLPGNSAAASTDGQDPAAPPRSLELSFQLKAHVPRGPGCTIQVGVSLPYAQGDGSVDSPPLASLPLGAADEIVTRLEVPAKALGVWAYLQAEGYVEAKQERRLLKVTPGEPIPLSLYAPRGSTLRGRARLLDGTPPGSFSVQAQGSGVRVHHSRTQSDGRFEISFSGTSVDSVAVNAGNQGAGLAKLNPETSGRPPQDVQVTLHGSGELHGRLTDEDGQGLAGMTVVGTQPWRIERLRKRSATDTIGNATPRGRDGGTDTTDAAGQFSIRGLEPGEYVVLACPDHAKTFQPLHQGTIVLSESSNGQPLAFELPAKRLSVRVQGQAGRPLEFDPRPFAEEPYFPARRRAFPDSQVAANTLLGTSKDLRVAMVPLQPSDDPQFARPRWMSTGDLTRWEVCLPSAGPYVLEVGRLDLPGVQRQVAMQPGVPRREIVLEAGPRIEPGSVQLTIQDPPGTEGLRGYRLWIQRENGSPLGPARELPRGDLPAEEEFHTTLLLPAGRFLINLGPVAKGSGSDLFHLTAKRRCLPGAAEAWVQVKPGGRQELVLATRPLACVLVALPQGSDWQAALWRADSGAPIEAEYDTWTTEPGAVRVTLSQGGTLRHERELDLQPGQFWILRPVEGRLDANRNPTEGDWFRAITGQD